MTRNKNKNRNEATSVPVQTETLEISKARIIAEEAWRMLPDACKEIIGEELKEAYIAGIETDIEAAYSGTVVPAVEEKQETDPVAAAIQEHIEAADEQKRKEPFMSVGGKNYSMNDILQEVKTGTEFGKETVKDIISLTVGMLVRGKKQLKETEPEKTEPAVYQIEAYSSDPEFWTLIDTEGNTVKVDLTVGGELEEEMQEFIGNSGGLNSYFQWCRSLIGRMVQIDQLVPDTAAGKGIKLIEA